jgi:Hypothetical protein (DUF2513)
VIECGTADPEIDVKRDMDLVRKILFALEEHEHGRAPRNFTVEGYGEELVGYHVHSMAQAGLVRAIEDRAMGNPSPRSIPIALTWQGHEFLEQTRNDTLWNKAKNHIKEKGVPMTLDLLKDVLGGLAKQMIGLT